MVADACGYSTATVSRALNNSEAVTEPVRQEVLRTAAKLGYVGNNSARSLRLSRTGQFGVIVPTLNYAVYAGFLGAIQARSMEEGYTILVSTSDYRLDNEAEVGIKLLRSGVDGMVFVGNRRRPRLQTMLRSGGVPVVNTYVYDPSNETSTVGLDNSQIFFDSVTFLRELGHHNIGMLIGGAFENDRVERRIEGFLGGLVSWSLPSEPTRIANVEYTIDDGRRGMGRLLDTHQVTAVVCGSDMLALGAILECRDRGLSVPDDVSVVGGDDLDFSASVSPSITSIRVPTQEIGRSAADYLLKRAGGSRETVHVKFETKLLVRGSTAPPRRTRSARRSLPRK